MFYDASDAQFLISKVSDHTEVDDGERYGHVSYKVRTDENTGAQMLEVSFQDDNGVDLQGEWRLRLVSLTKTGEPEAEEVAGE